MNKQTVSLCRPYSCPVKAARDLRLDIRVPCGLEPESIGYAVRRFIRRSPALMKRYAGESYRFRLGKRRKADRAFAAPAVLLELPGAWAQVRLTVTPAGVTIRRVGLYPGLPSFGALRDS